MRVLCGDSAAQRSGDPEIHTIKVDQAIQHMPACYPLIAYRSERVTRRESIGARATRIAWYNWYARYARYARASFLHTVRSTQSAYTFRLHSTQLQPTQCTVHIQHTLHTCLCTCTLVQRTSHQCGEGTPCALNAGHMHQRHTPVHRRGSTSADDCRLQCFCLPSSFHL